MSRTSKHERELRIAVVYRLMITGYTRPDILQVGTERGWGVERTIDEYMAEARKRVIAKLNETNEEVLATHLAHRENLRKVARAEKNYSIELLAAQDEARLRDLYKAAQTMSFNVDLSKLNLTDSQLERLVKGESVASVLTNPDTPTS